MCERSQPAVLTFQQGLTTVLSPLFPSPLISTVPPYFLTQLKEDGRTSVGNWPWSVVVIPTMAISFVLFLLWAFIHYLKAGKDLETRWNMELVNYHFGIFNVDDIEVYHERYLFRDVMMIFVYFVTIMYAGLINATRCHNCNTPFGLLSTSVIIINSLRLLFTLLRAYFEYHRLRHLADEVRAYKAWRDEHRLREFSVPSLTNRLSFNIYSALEAVCFFFIVCFIGMGTIWVEGGACEMTCSKGYHLTKHLVVVLYVFESVYALSVVALVYFRRSLNIERIESMIAWINADNLKKAEIRKERLKKGVVLEE